MKSLRRCGFFSDLAFGDPDFPSIQDCVGDKAALEPVVQALVRYLRRGIRLASIPLVLQDVVSQERQVIGPLALLTDGEWVWRSDLPYYVEKYSCSVPEVFLAHAKARNWKVPRDKDVNLADLAVWESELSFST